MAPEAPKIRGLFTEYRLPAFLSSSVEPWYDNIRDNPVTSDCRVVSVGWYKKQNGVEHEFLRFDISSPDKVHTSIVIAERGGGDRNPHRDPSDAAQATDTIAPIDTMAGPSSPPDVPTPPFASPDAAGDSTASSADEGSAHIIDKAAKTNRKTKRKSRRPAPISSFSSSTQRGAHDLVSYATLDSAASAQLERKCTKAARVCTLTFSERVMPSANELATLLYMTSKHEPTYSVTNTQCYWFVETVFEALKVLFAGAEQDTASHRGGTWNRVPIRTKESVEEVCAKYRAARAALEEEIEQKRRVERQQEEERQREREQRLAAEEAAKREREQRRAAEDVAKAAEERARAAEQERQKEREQRQAAEEANAKLLRELEALRAAARQEVTFGQYLALLTVADAFMVTSLREGMALRTYKYIECREERNRALILCEFTGMYSYSVFRSCFAVKPYDARGTAKAIYQALTMSDEEAASRWQDLHIHVVIQPPRHPSPLSSPKACVHTMSMRPCPLTRPPLHLPCLILKYRHSVRDMSKSTMMEMFKGSMVELPEATMWVLESMADDPKYEIWVLSGLPVKGALERLAERVPRFTERTLGSIVEECATSVVWRFWTGPPDSTAPIDDDATTTTTDIFSPPVNTTTSPSSDSHHSDRSWARRQAAEVQSHIFDCLGERYGLRIIPRQNSFFVLLNNISCSTAVGTILHPGGPARPPLGGGAGVGDADYDGWWSSTMVGSGAGRTSGTTGGRVSSAGESILVLGIGGDENLLRRLNELNNVETVSTSRRGTDARWKLDPREVLGVLDTLAQVW
ncbi:glycosyltransferase family 20-domain-containing protein [Pisolithus marmoratus]|nr:glycosyltransferase family 20-domain-containing protein [Pisolithus marmoratus]